MAESIRPLSISYNRAPSALTVSIEITSPFDFTMEQDFSVVRGHDAVTGIIGWEQGEAGD